MDINIAKLLIIETLNQPENTRVDFLMSKSKESNYRKEAFYSLMDEAISYWENLIRQSINKLGVVSGMERNSLKIPLVSYTNGMFFGHVGLLEIGLLKDIVIEAKNIELATKQTKKIKLNAPALGFFCNLINKIGIDKKDEAESAAVYCKRICDKFKLPYSDRVRQNYNVKETKKLLQALNERVYPLIDSETIILIQKHLDTKQPPKQNLYA